MNSSETNHPKQPLDDLSDAAIRLYFRLREVGYIGVRECSPMGEAANELWAHGYALIRGRSADLLCVEEVRR